MEERVEGMRIKELIEQELERQILLKKQYEISIDRLPQGNLSFTEKNGKRYYTFRKEGNVEYLGLGEPTLVTGVQQRHLEERMLKNLNENISGMKLMLKRLRSVNPVDVMKSLPSVYRNLQILRTEDGIFADIKAWEYGGFEKNEAYADNLKHRTAKGELVRSKSEVTIANMLYDRGIPYHYEEMLWLNGSHVAPDFTIAVRGENRVKYLEHCGLITDPGYFRNYCNKQYAYVTAGLQIGRDVFFTYEDECGSIDTRAIALLIETYFR